MSSIPLTEEEHAKNNLPDVLARWRSLQAVKRNGELTRKRIEQSFSVRKADIVAQRYDLSLNRYKEVVQEEVAHRPPSEILKSLSQLEAEIQQDLKKLEDLLR